MTAAAAPPRPEAALLARLKDALGRTPACEPVAADASPTRYYRLDGGQERKLAMAADGPAAVELFIGRGKILADAGVRVPAVHAADPARGYAVIEDFGDRLYCEALQEDGVDRRALYEAAWEAGARVNAVSATGLPRFDAALLEKEASYLPKWYAAAYRNLPLDKQEEEDYAQVAGALQKRFAAQPFVPCHRDWHSRNLFALDAGPGVIDYAAMLHGPLCYDAASLLHDLYVDFEEEEKLDLLVRHWELLRARGLPVPTDFGAYFEDCEWTALQRLVKILGQFVFLERDRGRPGFESFVPKCERMVHAIALRYRELRPLALLIERRARG